MSAAQWFAAPAKINLALHVTGRRRDGYHRIETIAVFADIGDRIGISAAGVDSFHIEGPEASALAGEAPTQNLVVRARDLMRDVLNEHDIPAPPAAIVLDKQLPAGSGIGGGSADAAATLAGLMLHWQADAAAQAIRERAVSLGADVPMCLASRPLVASGAGEEIRPLSGMPSLALVLANPRRHVSTPAVFAALEKRDNPPLPADGMTGLRSAGDWAAWLSRNTRNDLQASSARLTPEIEDCLAALETTAPLLARMSGSGATCFGIYDDMNAARAAAKDLLHRRPDWWITATETGATP
ncbi:4-(cytidine 5'-diphospho)-2-C-methyl-D-erythritol kinase [Oricola thermophila]|uniref:4-diphosphocytidyl-2-C-methyl-D-erythritol kinase n=1 Tax=Oricola thermophila TaxID=2742145 RepID=A0A6N1VIF7_9HYPH|nr:4-(cytidine 5'-diphospho)-2-C-methyl-D-erythritol kinase [Oricola thermophila]QKV18929.1 4-(cytidine 5'-diphospho)-2-C-methyl-D-erythritol kinase [Oricola thermophila]